MKNKLLMLVVVFSLSAVSAHSAVTAMFHPYDATFAAIVERFETAEKSIDMALYNIDASQRNPIVALLASDKMQARMKSGALKVRLIFEGYEKKDKNQAKMIKFEELGVDVRYLGSSRKMHHKFAVVDGGLENVKLITGSANWSMSSRQNYNENILFFDEEFGIAHSYQKQFDLLWSISKEIGVAKQYKKKTLEVAKRPAVQSYFNTDNFDIKNNRLYKSKREGYVLTKRIVKAIDSAQSHLEIATTRIKLRPIYDALLRAAKRGVKIDIVVTMGQYKYKHVRKRMKEEACANPFEKKCSTSKNFAVLLSRTDFEGHKNVDVRLKYFNVNKDAYLNKQMHSKYMIVDDHILLTGSFNWSYSAEFNHIENLVVVHGDYLPAIVDSFERDFDYLWSLGRGEYSIFVNRLAQAAQAGEKADCRFAPMSLSFHEIDYMLGTARRHKSSLKKVCL